MRRGVELTYSFPIPSGRALHRRHSRRPPTTAPSPSHFAAGLRPLPTPPSQISAPLLLLLAFLAPSSTSSSAAPGVIRLPHTGACAALADPAVYLNPVIVTHPGKGRQCGLEDQSLLRRTQATTPPPPTSAPPTSSSSRTRGRRRPRHPAHLQRARQAPPRGPGNSHVLGCLCLSQRDDLLHEGCELLCRVLAATVHQLQCALDTLVT